MPQHRSAAKVVEVRLYGLRPRVCCAGLGHRGLRPISTLSSLSISPNSGLAWTKIEKSFLFGVWARACSKRARRTRGQTRGRDSREEERPSRDAFLLLPSFAPSPHQNVPIRDARHATQFHCAPAVQPHSWMGNLASHTLPIHLLAASSSSS